MTDHDHPTDVYPDEEAAQYDDPGAHDVARDEAIGDAGDSVIPLDRAGVLSDPSFALLTADGPAKKFLSAVLDATQTYGTQGTQLEVVVRPKAKT